MRFMIIGKATKETEAGILPKPEEFEAMGKYNEELVKSGILLAAEGLAPTSKGARVKFNGDERTVIDGPFAEAKEVVAGLAILEADSKEAAIALAREFLSVAGDGECELRQLYEAPAA